MLWQDVLVARRAEPAQIAGAVGDAFAVPAADVVVVDDLQETLTRVTAQMPLLVQRTFTAGEFSMLLSLYVLNGDTERQVATPQATLLALRRIADSLHSDILVSDETTLGDEPWLLAQPGGSVEQVLLDSDAMARDEYRVIRRVAPVRAPVPA